MKHLFPRVGEKSVQVPTDADRDAYERKLTAVMQSWASRSIINATIRLSRSEGFALTRGKLGQPS